MAAPMRSQSFRHRARPPPNSFLTTLNTIDTKRYALDVLSNNERRRSTPTISRRSSFQKGRIMDSVLRTDVWPEPKQISEIEERFLQLPDSEDYTRVRQFKIDAKGAVVSRGDSFRRKRNSVCQTNLDGGKNDRVSPFPINESECNRIEDSNTTATATTTTTTIDSRSTSVSSNESSILANKLLKTIGQNYSNGLLENVSLLIDNAPTTSHPSYKVYVLGQTGSGKTSLISQFVTSEYRNAFADEIDYDSSSNFVSVNIGGYECDLTFLENDPKVTSDWKEEIVDAYILVYSIDQKSSFRTVLNALDDIREKRKSVPIILAGNKIDLVRRRAVLPHEVKCAAVTYDVIHFEISVALNHDVDDLLVGIVAGVKESFQIFYPAALKFSYDNASDSLKQKDEILTKEPEEFRAAIQRFSLRKRKQMDNGKTDLDAGKCTHLNPVGLFEKFRQWRRGVSKC